MFEAFNKVTRITGLGPNCPARLNIVTGELQLNYDVWPHLTEAQRRDVVSHEEGHWVLQTRSEELADRYSLIKQSNAGHSLKQAVAAMADILDPTDPEHVNRAWARFELAKQLDKMKNCNCGGRCGGCNAPTVRYSGANPDQFVNFLGICLSKKCKEKKAQKFQMKLETQASKNEARVLLAEQGVKSGVGGFLQDVAGAAATVVSGLTGGVGGAIAGIAGGGENVATTALTTQTTPAATAGLQSGGDSGSALAAYLEMQAGEAAAKKKKQTTWIIVGIVAALVVGVGIYLISKKKG